MQSNRLFMEAFHTKNTGNTINEAVDVPFEYTIFYKLSQIMNVLSLV